jgi:hypothetical protein
VKKNDLVRIDDGIFRVLDLNEGKMLLIDCFKQTMPQWRIPSEKIEIIGEEELQQEVGYTPAEFSSLSAEQQRVAHERFTVVAPYCPISVRSH